MAKLELSRDWKEFLGALISRNVKFLLVGGHAIAIHGNPRLTEDLDVFSEPTLENGNKLRAALVDFGFGSVAPTAEKLAESGKVFMLGKKPQRIDILTHISGVSFDQAWNGRLKVDMGGSLLAVIGRKELIANKLASGREKDLLDVAMLRKPKRPKKNPRRRRSS